MNIRAMETRDEEAVKALHSEAGYSFEWPNMDSPLIETALVVVNEDDQPIACCLAKRAPEILLAMTKRGHPLLRLAALRLIHGAMRDALTARGYKEANCFLPPELERGYGRHLQRSFGWKQAWTAFTIFGTDEKQNFGKHSFQERQG